MYDDKTISSPIRIEDFLYRLCNENQQRPANTRMDHWSRQSSCEKIDNIGQDSQSWKVYEVIDDYAMCQIKAYLSDRDDDGVESLKLPEVPSKPPRRNQPNFILSCLCRLFYHTSP
jgi:hypothetical protein